MTRGAGRVPRRAPRPRRPLRGLEQGRPAGRIVRDDHVSEFRPPPPFGDPFGNPRGNGASPQTHHHVGIHCSETL